MVVLPTTVGTTLLPPPYPVLTFFSSPHQQSYSRGRKHCVSLGDVGDPWGERERSVSMVLKVRED